MNERRSLNSALKETPKVGLTPEAMAFISGGVPGKKVEEAPAKVVPVKAAEVPEPLRQTIEVSSEPVSTGASEGKEAPRSRRATKVQQAPQNSMLNKLLIPVTTRFDPRTAEALRRAHLEQRIKGLEPSTMQEIIQLAVQAWLRENDYLD